MRRSRSRDFAATIGIALLAAAVVQQFRLPRSQRTWRGTLAGVVPYDLRPPTFDRIRDSLWAPDDGHLLLPRAAGVGWSPNLARILVLLRDWRPIDE